MIRMLIILIFMPQKNFGAILTCNFNGLEPQDIIEDEQNINVLIDIFLESVVAKLVERIKNEVYYQEALNITIVKVLDEKVTTEQILDIVNKFLDYNILELFNLPIFTSTLQISHEFNRNDIAKMEDLISHSEVKKIIDLIKKPNDSAISELHVFQYKKTIRETEQFFCFFTSFLNNLLYMKINKTIMKLGIEKPDLKVFYLRLILIFLNEKMMLYIIELALSKRKIFTTSLNYLHNNVNANINLNFKDWYIKNIQDLDFVIFYKNNLQMLNHLLMLNDVSFDPFSMKHLCDPNFIPKLYELLNLKTMIKALENKQKIKHYKIEKFYAIETQIISFIEFHNFYETEQDIILNLINFSYYSENMRKISILLNILLKLTFDALSVKNEDE